MTNVAQKYNEFVEAVKEDILNNPEKCKITKPSNASYNAEFAYEICGSKIGFVVAKTFVCYYNELFRNVFSQEDINRLNKAATAYFEKDKTKYERIAELKRELAELEKDIV